MRHSPLVAVAHVLFSFSILFSVPAQGAVVTQLFVFTCNPQTDVCPNGADPTGALVQASDGDFYGATAISGNGSLNQTGGTIFRISRLGQLTTLFTFLTDQVGNFSNGKQPLAGLVEGKDGFLYGTTVAGGANKAGVIFKMSKAGSYMVLHNFCALTSCGDGSTPQSPVILGNDGNLYGTTSAGGAANAGTIFRVSPTGSFTVLHTFNDTSDGGSPLGGLVQASDGNFYGSARTSTLHLEANLFRITPQGQYTVLANLPFPGNLQGQLIQASDGKLYGVVQYGFVFRSNLSGTSLQMIHDLTVDEVGSGGVGAGLIQASDGNLWGTSTGQSFGPDYGVIYKLNLAGTFLGNFPFNCSNGGLPTANVLQASDRNLYGTTSACGLSGGQRAFGTVYVLMVGLHPPMVVIAAFSPLHGPPGTLVTLRGDHFIGTTAVKFNGVSAAFHVLNGKFLTTVVPTGASTGPISVTNPGGTTTSIRSFTVP